MNTKSKNIIKRILSIFLVIVTVLSSLSLDNISNLFVKKAEAANTYTVNWGNDINTRIIQAAINRFGYGYADPKNLYGGGATSTDSKFNSTAVDPHIYACDSFVGYVLRDLGFSNIPLYASNKSADSFAQYAQNGYSFTDVVGGNRRYLYYNGTKLNENYVVLCSNLTEFKAAIDNPSNAGKVITLQNPVKYKTLCNTTTSNGNDVLRAGMILSWEATKDNGDYLSAGNHSAICLGNYTNTSYGSNGLVDKDNKDILAYGNWLNTQLRSKYTFPSSVKSTQMIWQDNTYELENRDGAILETSSTATIYQSGADRLPQYQGYKKWNYRHSPNYAQDYGNIFIQGSLDWKDGNRVINKISGTFFPVIEAASSDPVNGGVRIASYDSIVGSTKVGDSVRITYFKPIEEYYVAFDAYKTEVNSTSYISNAVYAIMPESVNDTSAQTNAKNAALQSSAANAVDYFVKNMNTNNVLGFITTPGTGEANICTYTNNSGTYKISNTGCVIKTPNANGVKFKIIEIYVPQAANVSAPSIALDGNVYVTDPLMPVPYNTITSTVTSACTNNSYKPIATSSSNVSTIKKATVISTTGSAIQISTARSGSDAIITYSNGTKEIDISKVNYSSTISNSNISTDIELGFNFKDTDVYDYWASYVINKTDKNDSTKYVKNATFMVVPVKNLSTTIAENYGTYDLNTIISNNGGHIWYKKINTSEAAANVTSMNQLLQAIADDVFEHTKNYSTSDATNAKRAAEVFAERLRFVYFDSACTEDNRIIKNKWLQGQEIGYFITTGTNNAEMKRAYYDNTGTKVIDVNSPTNQAFLLKKNSTSNSENPTRDFYIVETYAPQETNYVMPNNNGILWHQLKSNKAYASGSTLSSIANAISTVRSNSTLSLGSNSNGWVTANLGITYTDEEQANYKYYATMKLDKEKDGTNTKVANGAFVALPEMNFSDTDSYGVSFLQALHYITKSGSTINGNYDGTDFNVYYNANNNAYDGYYNTLSSLLQTIAKDSYEEANASASYTTDKAKAERAICTFFYRLGLIYSDSNCTTSISTTKYMKNLDAGFWVTTTSGPVYMKAENFTANGVKTSSGKVNSDTAANRVYMIAKNQSSASLSNVSGNVYVLEVYAPGSYVLPTDAALAKFTLTSTYGVDSDTTTASVVSDVNNVLKATTISYSGSPVSSTINAAGYSGSSNTVNAHVTYEEEKEQKDITYYTALAGAKVLTSSTEKIPGCKFDLIAVDDYNSEAAALNAIKKIAKNGNTSGVTIRASLTSTNGATYFTTDGTNTVLDKDGPHTYTDNPPAPKQYTYYIAEESVTDGLQKNQGYWKVVVTAGTDPAGTDCVVNSLVYYPYISDPYTVNTTNNYNSNDIWGTTIGTKWDNAKNLTNSSSVTHGLQGRYNDYYGYNTISFPNAISIGVRKSGNNLKLIDYIVIELDRYDSSTGQTQVVNSTADGESIYGTVRLTANGTYTEDGLTQINTYSWAHRWYKLNSNSKYEYSVKEIKVVLKDGTILEGEGEISSVYDTSIENGSTQYGPIFNITNDTSTIPFGIKKVYKVDGVEHALKNVVYGVYSNANCTNELFTLTTGNDGVATYDVEVTNPSITYYVREKNNSNAVDVVTNKSVTLEAPNNTTFKVVITKNGVTYTRTAGTDNYSIDSVNNVNVLKEENEEVILTGGFGLKKVFIDADGNKVDVSGVTYGVYSDSNCTTLLEPITTGPNGYAVIDVNEYFDKWVSEAKVKTVYVKELSVADARIAGTDVDVSQYLTVDPTTYKYEVTGINTKVANANSSIDDYSTCKVVETNMSTNVSTTLSTTATVLNGTYKVKISEKTDGVIPQYGWFGVKKIDKTTGESISGIQFNVYSDESCTNATLIGNITTETNGLGTFEFDPITNPISNNSVNITKTVYVKEVASSATALGFEADTTVIRVEVTFADTKENCIVKAYINDTDVEIPINTNSNPKFMYFIHENTSKLDFYGTWNAVKYNTEGDRIANTAFVYLPYTILNRNSISTTSFSSTLKSINDGTTSIVYNGTTYKSSVKLLRALAKATNDYVWATYPNATDNQRAKYAVEYFYNQLGLVEGSTTGTTLNSQNWYKNNEFAYAITTANNHVAINRVYINGTAPVVTTDRQVFKFANDVASTTESVSKAFYFLEIYTPKGVVFPGNNAFGIADITSNYIMSKDSEFDSSTNSLNPNKHTGDIAVSTEIVLRDDYKGIYTILDNDSTTLSTKVAGTNQEYLVGGFGLKKTFVDKNNVEQTVSGVQYGVYSNADCTKLLGTGPIITDDTGYAVIDINSYLTSAWIETSPTKTVYVKELSVENAKIAGTNIDISSYLELDPTVYKYVVTGISENDAYSTTGVKNYSTCTIVETNMTTNASTTLSTTAAIANNTYNVKITNKNNEVYKQDAWFGIKKIDETTGNPVEGIQFNVYSNYSNNNLSDLLGTITTGEDGLGTYDFDEINPLNSNDVVITRTVYVQEVGSTAEAKGYTPNNDIIKVDVTFAANKEDCTITATNLTTNMTVDIETNANPKFMYFIRENTPKPAHAAVGIKKYYVVDGQEIPLSGVKFGFYTDPACKTSSRIAVVTTKDGTSTIDMGSAAINLANYPDKLTVSMLNVETTPNSTPIVVYVKETSVAGAKNAITGQPVDVELDSSIVTLTLWASDVDAEHTTIISAKENDQDLDLTEVLYNNYHIKAFRKENIVNSYHGMIGVAKVDDSTDHNPVGGMKFNVYSNENCTTKVGEIITADDGDYKGIGTLDVSRLADATHSSGAWTLNTAKTFYIREDQETAESKNFVWNDTVIKAVVTPSEELNVVNTVYSINGTDLASGSSSVIGTNNITSSIINVSPRWYTVSETFVDDEDPSSTTTIVYAVFSQENTETIDQSAIKEWANSTTKDTVKEVYVTLYANDTVVTVDANGTAITNPAKLTATNNWTYTWPNLKKHNADGSDIVYTIKETKIVLADEYNNIEFNSENEILDYFTMLYSKEEADLIVKNTLRYYPGSLGIKKYYIDSNGVEHSLSGVEYGVYSDATCDTLVAEGTTNNSGVFTYSIPNNTWKSVDGKVKVFYVKELDNSDAVDTVTNKPIELKEASTKIYKATITLTRNGDTLISTTTYEVVGSNEIVETDTNNNIVVAKQSNEAIYKANLAAMKVDQSGAPVANVKFNVYAASDVTNNTLKNNATPIYTMTTKVDGIDFVDVIGSWTDAELSGAISSKVFYIQEDKNSVESLNLVWNSGLIKATVTPVLSDADRYNTVYEGADEVIDSEDGSYAILKRKNTRYKSVPAKKELVNNTTDIIVKNVYYTLYDSNNEIVTKDVNGNNILNPVDVLAYPNYTYTWDYLDYYTDYHTVETRIVIEYNGKTYDLNTTAKMNQWFTKEQINSTDWKNTIKSKISGKVTINKVDIDGNPLSATFGIYSDAECTQELVTTNVDNTYTYTTSWYPAEGATKTVYIKELTAKDGYVAYPYVIKAVITGNEDIDNCTVAFSVETTGADTTRLQNAEANKYSMSVKANYFYAEWLETTITIPNEPISKTFRKTDITGSEEIAGAQLAIKTKQAITWNGQNWAADSEIASWISTTTPHVLKALPSGTYEYYEKVAPDGYASYTITKTFTIVNGEVVDLPAEAIPNEKIPIEIYKQSFTSTTTIPNAKLQLYNADKSFIITWTTGDDDSITLISTTDATTAEVVKENGQWYIRIEGIPTGTYTLEETEAPSGFAKAESINVVVEDSKVTQKVIMKDKPYRTEISKTDIATGNLIEGATLKITTKQAIDWYNPNTNSYTHYDANAEILTFTSAKEVKTIDYLPVGTYTLTETVSPSGFAKSESVDFTVVAKTDSNINGETWVATKVEMKDKPYRTKISKTDVTTGKLIEGAIIEVYTNQAIDWYNPTTQTYTHYNKDAKILDFTSSTTPKEINYLPVGSYKLKETSAPYGFVIVEDVNFSVVAVENTNINGETWIDTLVTMQDDITKLQIIKTNSDGTQLGGATLQLYANQETKIYNPTTQTYTTYAENALIREWTSSATAYEEFKYLPVNSSYTLKETNAPEGYGKIDNMIITIANTSDVQVTRVVDLKLGYIDIYKTDTLGDVVEGVHFKLYRGNELLEELVTNEQGYAKSGYFVTEYINSNGQVVKYTNFRLEETSAPEGYVISFEPQTFTMTETQNNYLYKGFNVVNEVTRVDFDKYNVYTNEKLAGCTLAIYKVDDNDNIVGDAIDIWVTDGINAHSIYKLAPGKYMLKEIDSPNGYALASDLIFTVSYTKDTQVIDISDAPLTALPETGGVGTMLFTLGGLLMMLIALLLKKKTI